MLRSVVEHAKHTLPVQGPGGLTRGSLVACDCRGASTKPPAPARNSIVTQLGLDPLDLDDAPPEALEQWLSAVRTMDRNTLDVFVRRTWRAASLRAVAIAVDMRRAQLDGE